MLKDETHLAYCGLVCGSCPIHRATLEQDKTVQLTMRESIAIELARIYGISIQASGINDCDGCKAENGRLFSGCSQCGIRECAMQKNMENCAYCREFACEILTKHYSFDPGSKERIEDIMSKLR